MTAPRPFVRALVLLALMGCATSEDPPAVSPSPEAPSPREASDARIVARFDAILDALLARGLPGASCAVVLPDGRVLAAARGLADADTGRALTPSDRMLSGSVGKTYFVALFAEQIAAGRIAPDVPVSDQLPADQRALLARLPNGPAVTPRQLLRHRSGLPRYVYAPGFFPALVAEPDRVWTGWDRLAWVFDREPLFAPDADFLYSDTNYVLLGVLLEAVTGRPCVDLVRERLLEPLGLRDTLPTDTRHVPGVAQGHVVAGLPLGFPARTRADDAFVFDVQFEWTGGGFASTPSDLARWARLLWGGHTALVPDAGVLLDAGPAPELGADVRYGWATMLRDTPQGPLWGHDGFMPGYLASTGWLPRHELAFAFQTNTDDAAALGRRPSDVLLELADAVLAERDATDG
ncbi:MAG: beta-lactamase family protein [Planctomycetes bacterium]|nr:beta-lactamase family protein [Planctomycetota bacterium]